MKAKHLQTNQVVIFDNDGNKHFFSYETHIATLNRYGKLTYLSTSWDYSVTTRKYFYQFIETYASTLQNVAVGDQQVAINIIACPTKDRREFFLHVTSAGTYEAPENK